MTDYTDPAAVRGEIRAALAACDTDTAVAAIAQMRETRPGWADRIEREAIAAGIGRMRSQAVTERNGMSGVSGPTQTPDTRRAEQALGASTAGRPARRTP